MLNKTISRLAAPIAIALAVALGVTIGATSVSNAESSTVKVCVGKKDKAVYYRAKCLKSETVLKLANSTAPGLSAFDIWKSVGNTGSEQDFLTSLRGTNGSNGSNGQSVWKTLNDCKKAVLLAQNVGTNLAVKSERDRFELETNCIVEKVNTNEGSVKRRLDYGLPIISEIKFLSIDSVNTYYGSKLANYEIRVRNFDALSGDQPTTLCSHQTGDLTQISGDRYHVKAIIYQTDTGIYANAGVYFKKNGVCSHRAYLGRFWVNEDPAKFISTGWFPRWLARRGWN